MSITPVQSNIQTPKNKGSYRNATGSIKTVEYTKPLPAQGHLVHDTLTSVPKFWIKDIAYDIKAVKDGLSGKANDHQSGRLNDVGLKVGGIGIATYLASRTTDPKARVMEYVGLGTFLAAMSLYPKIAINTPSRAVHGFDIGKEYIDDQGRKKSVFQDSNYIPFDMYRGEYLDEDLDVIGDRMGIPRNIHNRHDLIKEQMRKIATQNNTLWMLTAGLATPILTALTCCGLEKLVSPSLEYLRNGKNNSVIKKMLKRTQDMSENSSGLKSNSLSKDIEKIVNRYKGKEVPESEVNKIVDILTKNIDENLSIGVREDIEKLLRSSNGGFEYSEKTAQNILNTIKSNIGIRNKTLLENVLLPTEAEVSNILKKVSNNSNEITPEGLDNLTKEFLKLYEQKIVNEPEAVNKNYLSAEGNRIINTIVSNIKKNPARTLTESSAKDLVEYAKVLGEFKHNLKILKKCKSAKFEETQETVLARSYEKFENTLFDVLGIKYKDLKLMRESEEYTLKVLDEKMKELAKDEPKYNKAVKKLVKVMEDMDVKLNGKSENNSHIKDLITAIENNYNKTAKRLNNINGAKFKGTIDKLVSEDVKELTNSLKDSKEVFDLLDGTLEPDNKLKEKDYVKAHAKGVGSSKRYDITRIIERYQGVKNSFNRMLHTMDNYRLSETLKDEEKYMANTEYGKKVSEIGRNALLTADSAQHIAKLGTVNNPTLYKDIMNSVWSGKVSDSMKNAMGEKEDFTLGNQLARFKKYIIRFKEVFGNNDIDFTKPNHRVGGDMNYTQDELTRMSNFNLVAQSPKDFAKKAAERRYGNKLWLRKASWIGASVLAVAFVSQLFFGKISNPHNIKRLNVQVKKDADK